MAVLILDQPTKEMDIFDTFFLVEYLRNWASTGRVVIMSLHPPTYEIFAMLTKVWRNVLYVNILMLPMFLFLCVDYFITDLIIFFID